MYVINKEISKDLDTKAVDLYNIPLLNLMENAGKAVYNVIEIEHPETNKKALIVCGSGNNAGDGFVTARYLFNNNWNVVVVNLYQFDDYRNIALENLKILLKITESNESKLKIYFIKTLEEFISILNLFNPDVLVDSIFGIGLSRPIEGLTLDVIEKINTLNIPKYSIDIPSGISADDGSISGNAVKADTTVTFSAPKIGNILYPGKEYSGKLIVKDIGIPEEIVKSNVWTCIDPKELKELIIPRKPDTHKGDYGKLLIIGGSNNYIGALVLAVEGALRSGAGLVYAGYKETLRNQYSNKLSNECIHIPLPVNSNGEYSDTAYDFIINNVNLKKSVLLVGPGIGRDKDAIDFVKHIYLTWEGTLILDADALFCIKEVINEFPHKSNLILTPHLGEMAYLTSQKADIIKKNFIDYSLNYSRSWNCTLVLKSATTIVSSSIGHSFYCWRYSKG